MNEQTNQNRQMADEAFRRSLTQLEDLLVDKALLSSDSAIAPTPHSLAQTDMQTDNQTDASKSDQPDQAHRFGGTLLDAIPLAQRLAQRLAAQPRTDPNLTTPDPSSSTETK